MTEPIFTIGEVANLLGISPKAIRHYHQLGLLDPPHRDANNYRRYGLAQIEQLQRILQLKRFGLSLEQIRILLHADDPHELAHIVLRQHAHSIRDEINRLQHQLAVTEAFLSAEAASADPHAPPPAAPSAMTTLSTAIRPHGSGVSDILVAVEQDALARLDRFDWPEQYELYWHTAGEHFIRTLRDAGEFIFWMERYLALATMPPDDLQGQAWLQELRQSPARRMLAHSLRPAPLPVLPEATQQQIQKLLPWLLYQQATPLQQQFLQLLLTASV